MDTRKLMFHENLYIQNKTTQELSSGVKSIGLFTSELRYDLALLELGLLKLVKLSFC
jgi:hypothetical protein